MCVYIYIYIYKCKYTHYNCNTIDLVYHVIFTEASGPVKLPQIGLTGLESDDELLFGKDVAKQKIQRNMKIHSKLTY